jgi:probable rRNA maturation factor
LKIQVFYDEIVFRLKGKKKVLRLIEKVITKEKSPLDDLNFIITNDENLLSINKQFLNHNYYTDVIAFGYEEKGRLSGEIYISIETVKENAHNYKVSLNEELRRVMIHGTLHLCGYEDDTPGQKIIMKDREDYYLEKFQSI